MEYGIQMYSLRDLTPTDMEGALRTVAALGYKKVEYAGFFDNTAAQIVTWMDRFGLSVSGTHTGWQELKAENFAATVAYHKEIGNKNIIIPGADLSTQQKLDDFIDFVNDVQPKLAAEGISLGFHNHAREFMLSDYGQYMHEEMQKRTKLAFEIDTYWAYVAGRDPIEVMEQLKDRVSVIHIKDGTAEGKGYALGEGTAPVAAVHKKAIELGMLMVVESEGLKPTGPEEVGRCMQYLRQLDMGK